MCLAKVLVNLVKENGPEKVECKLCLKDFEMNYFRGKFGFDYSQIDKLVGISGGADALYYKSIRKQMKLKKSKRDI